MSGDNGKLVVDNNIPSEETNKPKDICLSIKLISGGGLEVSGPGNEKLYDEPMCFYLLEKAKDHIKYSNSIAMKSNIVKPEGKGILDFARNFKR